MNRPLLLLASILFASVLNGCGTLNHEMFGDDCDFIKPTTSYSDKALEQDYELKENQTILSYGQANFETYGHFIATEGIATYPEGLMGYGLRFTIPEGDYLLSSVSKEGKMPTLSGKWYILHWKFKLPIVKGTPVLNLPPAREHDYLAASFQMMTNTKISSQKSSIYEKNKHNEYALNWYMSTNDTSKYAISLSRVLQPSKIYFNPARFLVKKVIPEITNNYQTLVYTGEKDNKLTFTYSETVGLNIKKAEKIEVCKSADGNYNIKGISFTIKDEEGDLWFRLHSFFNGDTKERFYDMLPFDMMTEYFSDEKYSEFTK